MTPTQTERPPLPARLRRASMWTLVLLGITAIAWALDVPTNLLILITAPATIACAISALVYSRGVANATGVRVWLSVAIGVAAMSFAAGLGLILILEPLRAFEECKSRAITHQALTQCELQYEKDYEELLERYSRLGTVRSE